MALKSRIGTYTFEHLGSSLALRATLSNIESLEQATGKEFYEFMTGLRTKNDVITLFQHMQIPEQGEEPGTRDQIHDAFFSDLVSIAKPEFQEKMEAMTFVLMGVNYQEALALLPDDDLDDTKKKPAA